MSEVKSTVVEVYGKFVVVLEDGPKFFDKQEDAVAAEVKFLSGAAVREEAFAFCASLGLDVSGKNAKGKANLIGDYLLWVEAGRPPAPTVEEVEAKDEAVAEAATIVVSDADAAEVDQF